MIGLHTRKMAIGLLEHWQGLFCSVFWFSMVKSLVWWLTDWWCCT